MGGDQWWRGFDSVVLDGVAPGARVLDVGCGDGSFVDCLVARGIDAHGVDPVAPARPRLRQQRVEEAGALGHFDAACAVMSLHHSDLDAVLSAIAGLLRPRGHLFVNEFAWETYDHRAAAWLARHDSSDADNSVAAWEVEHAGLHTDLTMRAALAGTFTLVDEGPKPYLARMLRKHDLEHEEERMIDEGSLPAIGRCYVAQRHRD